VSDRTEEFLRRGLAACKRPRLSPDAVSGILRSVQSREHAGRERTFLRRLYLLRAYWAIAGVASLWILWSTPWPAWLVPVCGAGWLIGTLHGDQRS
jgi:hypothetical protein